LGVSSGLLLIAAPAFAATSTPYQYIFGSFFEFVATGSIGPLCSNAIQYEKSVGPICGSLPNGNDRLCVVTGNTEKTQSGWVCHIYYDGELISDYEYFGLCADSDNQDYVDSLDACVSDNPIPVTPTGDNNKNLGCPEDNKFVGNPCNPATGNKTLTEVDAELANGNLRFIRTYNSQQDVDYGLGWGWQGITLPRLSVNGAEVRARRASGKEIVFIDIGGVWTSDSDVQLSLVTQSPGYILVRPNGLREIYDQYGLLISEERLDGNNLVFEGNPPIYNGSQK